MASRPRYETGADLGREGSAKDRIERAWNARLRKMPVKYGADWLAIRGDEAVAVIEYKNRPHQHDRYPTYLLSLHKWMTARQVAVEIGVPAILIVEFTDGMFWVTMADGSAGTGWGGRADRDDPDDQEPCQFIPMGKFARMKGVEENGWQSA